MVAERRPSISNRTVSTPLLINTTASVMHTGRAAPPLRLGLAAFTPPASPRHARSSSDLSTKTEESFADESDICYSKRDRSSSALETMFSGQTTDDGTLICPFDIEILKDQRGRDQTFGYGAWSTVLRGTCHSKPTSGLMTPPLSPLSKPPLLVAIKQAARKDAKPILQNEAKVLSHLMTVNENKRYIVTFFGAIISTNSLVLAAMPLSLDEHIRKSAVTANKARTTWNMAEPVVGSNTVWLNLAYKLISALSWLHNTAEVVHGDIKPGNVLLDRALYDEDMDMDIEQTGFPYEPLLVDFSSSQRLDTDVTPNTLSAITREYTAPELLSSKVLSDPKSTATTSSDVFSLAVTLLVAATGNTMVYSGSVFQRQAMATQGWLVIQAVRNGPLEEGARVPRQGTVERLLDQAVLRQGLGRIDAASWKSKTEQFIRGEPSKL